MRGDTWCKNDNLRSCIFISLKDKQNYVKYDEDVCAAQSSLVYLRV